MQTKVNNFKLTLHCIIKQSISLNEIFNFYVSSIRLLLDVFCISSVFFEFQKSTTFRDVDIRYDFIHSIVFNKWVLNQARKFLTVHAAGFETQRQSPGFVNQRSQVRTSPWSNRIFLLGLLWGYLVLRYLNKTNASWFTAQYVPTFHSRCSQTCGNTKRSTGSYVVSF